MHLLNTPAQKPSQLIALAEYARTKTITIDQKVLSRSLTIMAAWMGSMEFSLLHHLKGKKIINLCYLHNGE